MNRLGSFVSFLFLTCAACGGDRDGPSGDFDSGPEARDSGPLALDGGPIVDAGPTELDAGEGEDAGLTRDAGRACPTPCPSPSNASGRCVDGECTFTCDLLFGDCDGIASNGCESNLRVDERNCGGCGVVCPMRANANTICSSRECGFLCNTGYGDCNGSEMDGCETDVTANLMHCGRCGNVCRPAAHAEPYCYARRCEVRCDLGYENCDLDVANGCEYLGTSCP